MNKNRFEDAAQGGASFTDANLTGVTIEEAAVEGLTIMGYDIAALITAERSRNNS